MGETIKPSNLTTSAKVIADKKTDERLKSRSNQAQKDILAAGDDLDAILEAYQKYQDGNSIEQELNA